MIFRTPLLLGLIVGLALPLATSAPTTPPPGSPAYTYVNAVASPVAPTPSTRSMVVVNNPARVIVKLREKDLHVAQSSNVPATGLPGGSAISESDTTLATLVEKHAARSAVPLCPEHARGTTQQDRPSAGRAATLRERFPARATRAEPGAMPPDLSRTYILELDPRSPAQLKTLLESLRSDPSVVYAEEDGIAHTCYVPNDPYYSSSGSWGQSYDDLHGLKAIGATGAWDTTQGEGIVVAVIDTGVDYEHPDIKDNIWLNDDEIAGNGLDDDGNGFIDDVIGWDFAGLNFWEQTEDADPIDWQGHGSHVAGTVAAIGDNNEGVVGVAWKAQIMVVKGLDDSGSGDHSSLARCIIYAVDNGADVINASWGGESSSETLTDAVNYAHAHGVVFVAAAGNSASDAAGFSPANIPAAITVAALDPFGNSAYFSNYGSRIDVAAPGVDILSLEAQTAGYTRKDGTSMAAPHVSGLAALILASHPTFSVEQVRQALRTSATDLGAEGKDPKFGYGGINASAAVLMPTDVLIARILSPSEATAIAGPVSLIGSADGPGFSRYVLEFGAGATPDSWTTLRESTSVVTKGEIGVIDPAALPDGIYTVRLRSFTGSNTPYSDEMQIIVRYLEFQWPASPRVSSVTQQVKPGSSYTIVGSARTSGFQNYVLEWAPGKAAASGWSTEGFVLANDGQLPVASGPLGTWTPPPSPDGYFTIRLTVNGGQFARVDTSQVFAQPLLASGSWPALVASAPDDQGPTLARQADGTSRLVCAGRAFPVTLSSFAFDGSIVTAQIDSGSNFPPAAADLDGQAGDEVIVTNGHSLEVFSPTLEHVRTIPAPFNRYFGLDQITLADLDRDGVPEILAPSRQYDAVFTGPGELHILRADGTPFSSVPAPTFTTEVFSHAHVLAADLDGDGIQEIVMGTGGLEQRDYTLVCFRMDGSPHPEWPEIHVSDTKLWGLSAADLDHDGRSELVVSEHDVGNVQDRIRVVNANGTVREGWPVAVGPYIYRQSKLAIGDLDGDASQEIVVVTTDRFLVLRHDGSPWCEPWAKPESAPFIATISPLLADIDNDGVQEILAVNSTTRFEEPSTYYFECFLEVYDRGGTVRHSWPVFGLPGQQPFWSTPLVGDLNADGKTDLVVSTSLIQGGTQSGWLLDSSLTCLTVDTTLNRHGSNWVSNHSDPQNSRTPRTRPSFILRPDSRTTTAGSSVVLATRVGGHPHPRIQWQKDGVDIPGATSATLAFRCVQARDAGRYTVVLTSSAGTITSEATLTVSDETAEDSRALNLSTRAFMLDGANQPLIPGFVIAGTGTKRLLIRAVGPSLAGLGVNDFAADPSIMLKRYDPVAKGYVDLAGIDNWLGNESLDTLTAAVGAFPLVPGSRDAAMIVDAGPGHYTVFASASGDQASGIALVEIYDADDSSGPARLINVSNRGYVGVGGNIMIAGFVIANDGPKNLLIRAIGPGLIEHGVTDVLPDPQLLLYRMMPRTGISDLILSNDDWSAHPDAANTAAVAEQVGAFALAPGSKDAAFVATLQPGVYTIHALGVNDTTGEALVEIYVVR